MKIRAEAPWRAAFVVALGRSGSATMTAREAGVDRTTAYQTRARDAAFAASWDAARGEARAHLAAGGAAEGRPPVLARDEIVRSSKSGKPCVMRVGPGRWSLEAEAVFLHTLERTANVKRSAEAAGVSAEAVYARRAKWPAFAEALGAALRSGYLDVEILLIENARATLGDAEARPARSAKPTRDRVELAGTMSVGDAVNILQLHRAAVKGGKPQRYGHRAQAPDIETVRAEIMRKVEAMARKRGMGAA